MEFALTDRLRAALELVSGDATELSHLRRADAHSITLEHVQLLSSLLRRRQEPAPHVWVRWTAPTPATARAMMLTHVHPQPQVHELLQGAAPQLPARATKREPHPDLAPRLERLRNAQANREYAAMLGDVSGSSSAEKEEDTMASYKSQMGVGLNLIVSMGTMYIVGHYAGGTAEEPNGPRAVTCGLVLCILTMLVEVLLFVIGATRLDAKSHRRNQAAALGAGSNDLTKVRDNYGAKATRSSRKEH